MIDNRAVFVREFAAQDGQASSLAGTRVDKREMVVPALIVWFLVALHPAVAELGVSHDCGCLRRYTCGPLGATPFDPNKRTIVITHGWNPLPRFVRLTTPEAYARAILCRCGNRVNVLAWDWNAATFPSWSGRLNSRNAIRQGRLLACELNRIGIRPENTWLIGHSLGRSSCPALLKISRRRTGRSLGSRYWTRFTCIIALFLVSCVLIAMHVVLRTTGPHAPAE